MRTVELRSDTFTLPNEAMRAAMNALRSLSTVPQELSLTLQPDQVALAEAGSNVTVVSLDTGKEDLIQVGVRILASAKWKKDGIEINRELDPRGAIKDTFSLSEAGELVLKREVDMIGRTVKGTLVYHRRGSS